MNICDSPTSLNDENPNFTPHFTIGSEVTSSVKVSTLDPVAFQITTVNGVKTWSNKKIRLKGRLEFDIPFNLKNSTVQLIGGLNHGEEVNAQIAITGSVVVFTGSKFFSGNLTPWQGILVRGTAQFLFVNNQVEDAKNAIQMVSSQAYALIQNNCFNRNGTGVYAHSIAVNAAIYWNNFRMNSAPLAELTDKMGIFFDRCHSATIGVSTLDKKNSFKGLFRAINLNKSTVTVWYSEFLDNTTAINANLCVLTIASATVNNVLKRSKFSGSIKHDIQAKGTSLNVGYCEFEKCLFRNIVSEANNANENIDIHHNIISVKSDLGIYLRRSIGSSTIARKRNQIRYNPITIEAFGEASRVGVYIDGANSKDTVSVEFNNILVRSGGNGVTTSAVCVALEGGGDRVKIDDNTITSHNPSGSSTVFNSRWMIHTTNTANMTSGNSINRNSINMNTADTLDRGCCAIHLWSCRATDMCGNQTDKTLNAIHLFGVCGPMNFATNKLHNHSANGLLMQHSGFPPFIDVQKCHANEFLGIDTLVTDASTSGTVTDNVFWVDPNKPAQMPDPIISASGWFDNTQQDCKNVVPLCAGLELSSKVLDTRDAKLIEKDLAGSSIITAFDWAERKDALVKILFDPTLLNKPSNAAFSQKYQNASVQKFAEMDKLLYDGAYIPSNLANALDVQYFQLKNITKTIDSLDVVNQSAFNSFTQLPSAAYRQGRSAKLAQLEPISTNLLDLKMQVAAYMDSILTIYQNINQSLPENYTWENRQKKINAYFIKQMKGQAFSAADLAQIRIVAHECPQVAGTARERAIFLLPVEERGAYYNEQGTVPGCGLAASPGADRTHAIKSLSFDCSLYPNPVVDILTVVPVDMFSGKFQIVDTNGKVLISQDGILDVTHFEVSTSRLPQGIYFLRLQDTLGRERAMKFVK